MKNKVENTRSKLHSGHRARLRNKVKNLHIENLESHEQLEILLTYPIPRIDTNPIGHELIEAYGSISNVIDADFHDIQKIDGVGEQTAIFFKALREIIEVYNKQKRSVDKVVLDNTTRCVEFFRKNYDINDKEVLYVACLNKTFKLIKMLKVIGIDDSTITFNMKHLTKDIIAANADALVMFHTHPNGIAQPSTADLKATEDFFANCCALKIRIIDHLIFNETEHYSFMKGGQIKDYESKYIHLMRRNDVLNNQLKEFKYE